MMHIVRKSFIIFLVAVLLGLVAACPVCAEENKNYKIDSAWWEETSSGMIMARWDKPESATKYMVHLYKGSTMIFIGAWHSCVANGYNFTKDIVNKGTGIYYFRVYPEKTGEDDAVLSEALEVDRDMLKKAKSNLTPASASTRKKGASVDSAIAYLGPGGSVNETGTDRWIKTPDNKWVRQKADGSIYKGQWLEIDGKRYLFDSKGYMQKNGWRSSGSIWYYLGADGAMLVNTTTPDGYTVDELGQCIMDGKVYKSYLGPYLISKTTGESLKTNVLPITVLTITAKEYPAPDGRPKNIEITTSRGAEITEVQYSVPYESWQIGRSVTVTVKMAAVTDYYFKKGLKVNPSSNLTFKSAGGNEQTYTMKFSYLPKAELAVPEGFYMTEEGELHWDRVTNAVKYSIRVRGENIDTEKLETKKTFIDLSEYLGEKASVEISACGNTNSKSLKDSKPFKIENLDIFAEDNTIDGILTKSGSRLTFKDADGEKVTGWRELQGNWYHFTKGNADGPGWYQEKDTGYWYYFDDEHRMVTGRIIDNGKEYFLNDGSDSSFPRGAWIQNR